jgi:hypothetical protein
MRGQGTALEKPERWRRRLPAPSRRTGSAAVAALSLLAAVAIAAPPGPSTQQSDPELKQITVEAQRERAAFERRVKTFVLGITTAPYEESLARWQEENPICPQVAGLPHDDGEYFLSRLSQIAAAAGASLAPERCKPNFYVIVTSVADELAAAWSKRYPRMFGNANGNKVRQFLTASSPIRVWYNAALFNRDGTPCTLERGITICGGFTHPILDGGSTHLQFGVVRDLTSVIVLVDAGRVKGIKYGQLAAYIAMVGLAEIRVDAKTGDAPTILHLFTDSANAPALGMSAWDTAYLKALYRTRHEDKMQLLALETSMTKALVP